MKLNQVCQINLNNIFKHLCLPVINFHTLNGLDKNIYVWQSSKLLINTNKGKGVHTCSLYCQPIFNCRHLHALLDCVVKGLNDPDPGVRNSALFALGQFCEHLQVSHFFLRRKNVWWFCLSDIHVSFHMFSAGDNILCIRVTSLVIPISWQSLAGSREKSKRPYQELLCPGDFLWKFRLVSLSLNLPTFVR